MAEIFRLSSGMSYHFQANLLRRTWYISLWFPCWLHLYERNVTILWHVLNKSRVPDQNGISQACCIVEIYHSGLEPSKYTLKCERVVYLTFAKYPSQQSTLQKQTALWNRIPLCSNLPNGNKLFTHPSSPHTCTHTRMHAHMHARTHACMHPRMHTHTHTHVHIHQHTHTHTHTRTHARTHTNYPTQMTPHRPITPNKLPQTCRENV